MCIYVGVRSRGREAQVRFRRVCIGHSSLGGKGPIGGAHGCGGVSRGMAVELVIGDGSGKRQAPAALVVREACRAATALARRRPLAALVVRERCARG